MRVGPAWSGPNPSGTVVHSGPGVGVAGRTARDSRAGTAGCFTALSDGDVLLAIDGQDVSRADAARIGAILNRAASFMRHRRSVLRVTVLRHETDDGLEATPVELEDLMHVRSRTAEERDREERDQEGRDLEERDQEERDLEERDQEERDREERDQEERDREERDQEERDREERDQEERDLEERDQEERDLEERDQEERDQEQGDQEERDQEQRDQEERDQEQRGAESAAALDAQADARHGLTRRSPEASPPSWLSPSATLDAPGAAAPLEAFWTPPPVPRGMSTLSPVSEGASSEECRGGSGSASPVGALDGLDSASDGGSSPRPEALSNRQRRASPAAEVRPSSPDGPGSTGRCSPGTPWGDDRDDEERDEEEDASGDDNAPGARARACLVTRKPIGLKLRNARVSEHGEPCGGVVEAVNIKSELLGQVGAGDEVVAVQRLPAGAADGADAAAAWRTAPVLSLAHVAFDDVMGVLKELSRDLKANRPCRVFVCSPASGSPQAGPRQRGPLP
ncbi:hypothetical protein FNF31_07887 [Cafeteria roenbergensis]|uniref:PDZ domain-containing protein n=1 Tax=Cafeteria roenbergensis TaxID=33653 RepID=A0A5A8BZ91_CAFRO|nr:hypothetical protein FNF31_07887 [Cafeteria roenbergensis]